MGAPSGSEPVKTSALIAVAASCGVLAAVGAGVTSWAVISAGQNAATSAASQASGDDGVFVGDELNALLFTDEQLATFGMGGTVVGPSADYGTAAYEVAPPCSILMGQRPMSPAGARTLEMGVQGVTLRQSAVQFPTAEDAQAEFASVLQGAADCGTFSDDFGSTLTWTTISVTQQPAIVAGVYGRDGATEGVVVIGQIANAISYTLADTTATSLSADSLASAIAEATIDRIAP